MKPYLKFLLFGVGVLCIAAAGNQYFQVLPGLQIKHPITGATTATINGTNGTVTAGFFVGNGSGLTGLPSGGSSPWTNVSGVIKPASGQTTNEISFKSAILDNSTQSAFTLDTLNAWTSNAMDIVQVKNMGTNVFTVSNDGQILSGRGCIALDGKDNQDALVVARDESLGDLNTLAIDFAAGHDLAAFDQISDVHYRLTQGLTGNGLCSSWYELKTATTFYQNLAITLSDSSPGTIDWNDTKTLDQHPFLVSPFVNNSTAYHFGTGNASTGNLLELANGGTNKFTVAFDGSSSSSGTVSANAVDSTNDITFKTQSLTTLLTNKVLKAGDTMTGTLTAPAVNAAELYTGSFKIYSGTLTPLDAGTQLDFAQTNRDLSCTLTGNVSYTTANLVAGKCFSVRIIGCSTNSLATYPAGWHWYPVPQTNILASKWHRLTLRSWGTTDANVEAALAQEQ